MIEQALRKRLQPIVNRRRRFHLACRLSVCWLAAALAAMGLVAADWFWGWKSSFANLVLCAATVLATIVMLYRSYRIGPDYRAVARDIERRHPDLRALLLAAVEQEPQQPDGQFGYLQERVIGEAVRHAVGHDWLRSISSAKLLSAQLGGLVAMLFLAAVLSQLMPSIPGFFGADGPMLSRLDYQVTVSPGDTSVKSGSPVVILARFSQRVPPGVSLVFGPDGEQIQKIELTKNLEDPVFGGIIQQVSQNLFYHVEYEGRRTQEYQISVYENPDLVRADAKIVYPSYTKLPEKIIVDTRQISAVESSQVTLTFLLNKAVTTARLVPKEGTALDLTVDADHPNVYTTSLTAEQSQRYELKLADAQGLANEVPPRFSIEVHKNLPPELKPVFPNRDVVASALEELSLEAKVSDDYGLMGFGISYALAGAQSNDLLLGPSADPNQGPQIKHVLALEELDAKPDQLLTYYFWADDVGPNGQTRRTSSDMYFTEIRPFDEMFRENQSSQNQREQQQNQEGGQQQGGQQDEQLARLQKQIISATWNIKRQVDQSGNIKDRNDDLDVVRQSQADAMQKAQSALAEAEDPTQSNALEAATEHMKTALKHLSSAGESASPTELTPALASEQSAYQELLKLRQDERQVGLGRGSSASSSARSARSEQQLQQLELKQQENRYETDRLAQAQEQTAQREDLQVLNRLRELARRQSEMSEKLKEAEAALRQAQTEQEREEIRRQLKRLREEQIEALRDVDELQQRMEDPENRQRMADARDQLGQTRSRIRQSAEELEKEMVSRAITSTTRAQRELEQMRDEFRRNTSSQFTDQMRDMREAARQLDQRQDEIAEDIEQQIGANQKTLTDSGASRELADQMEQQRKSVEELTDQMKNVSEQAETSEPLLSRKLYDTLRETSTGNVDRALEAAGELLRRNFLPQAQEIERQAGRGIEQIKEGVEEAAKSVLGDEAESLRQARQQLDDLIRQVNEEVARAGGAGERSGDPNASQQGQGNEQQRADAQSGTRPGQGDPNNAEQAATGQQRADAQSGTGRGRGGDPNDPEGQTATQQQRAGAQPGAGSGQGGDPNGPQDAAADRQLAGGQTGPGAERRDRTNTGATAGPTGGGGDQSRVVRPDQFDPNGPITGRNYAQWSDRLRDVEEMLNEADLRNEAARVRDRARAMRAEFTRHGKEPQWDLVMQQITRPLTELRERISEELAQLQSDEAIVPIDRDPVPGRFVEPVRRYYENLGGDQ
jgi:hypothetical protein